jgi:predicted nucleic-acid-binding Zn-ribbon protein
MESCLLLDAMKQSHRCPKCQSTDIIGDVRPLDRTDDGTYTAQLATYRNPGAMLFRGAQKTPLRAWVCAECGFVEFYAEDPKVLKVTQK